VGEVIRCITMTPCLLNSKGLSECSIGMTFEDVWSIEIMLLAIQSPDSLSVYLVL